MPETTAEKIYEPDEDIVHYAPPVGWDRVTLCGATDWIGQSRGVTTKRKVTCSLCNALVEYVQSHEFD